jgi:hypothetical protein
MPMKKRVPKGNGSRFKKVGTGSELSTCLAPFFSNCATAYLGPRRVTNFGNICLTPTCYLIPKNDTPAHHCPRPKKPDNPNRSPHCARSEHAPVKPLARYRNACIYARKEGGQECERASFPGAGPWPPAHAASTLGHADCLSRASIQSQSSPSLPASGVTLSTPTIDRLAASGQLLDAFFDAEVEPKYWE